MRWLRLVSVVTILLSTLVLAQSTSLTNSPPVSKAAASSQPDPSVQAKVAEEKSVEEKVAANYGKLPLSFEANHGQTDPQVKFLSRTSAYSLFLTGDEAVLTLSAKKSIAKKKPSLQGFVSGHRFSDAASTSKQDAPSGADLITRVLRMKLQNANSAAKVTGIDEQAGTTNYFIGNDPAKWRTNVPTYAKVKYENIYIGIDLVYYGNQRQLEYDFIVAPGADPRRIAFDVSGANKIRQDAQGDLVFQMNDKMGDEEIRWHKPVVYQKKNGTRQEIAAHYTITDKNRVGFELAKYDTTRQLYIDPLIYSTYLGGSGEEYGGGIAVDGVGNAYVIGTTRSTDFPTSNPFQSTNAGGTNGYNAFVSKINAAGTAFVYSTYLGGSGTPYQGGTADDSGYGIAVDAAGNAYVTGATCSKDFPTVNPIQPTNAGGICDAFVAKIDPSGSALVYSTYLGGSEVDSGLSVAVDSAGNAYVTGHTFSADFPTMNPLQPANGGGANNESAFVTKINPTGSALIYSTYLGGSSSDSGWGIAVDGAGHAYVAGVTGPNFPTKNQLQPYGGAGDVFVSELNRAGSALVYSTYLGGSGGDRATGIALDSAGAAYVTGYTWSNDFPITPGAFQTVCGGGSCSPSVDAFVTKISPFGHTMAYSTYLGGSSSDVASAVAVDGAGSAYVIGATNSIDFPRKNPLPGQSGRAAFVTKLNTTGTALIYSTYLGGLGAWSVGIAVDGAGSAYATGVTGKNLPTVNALQPTYGGGNTDAFAAKIHIAAASTTSLSSIPNPSTYGQAVTFTAVVSSGDGTPADGETVVFMQAKNILGTGVLHGGSAIFTTSALSLGHHPIKAVYGGDANFSGSSSKSLTQVVNKAAE